MTGFLLGAAAAAVLTLLLLLRPFILRRAYAETASHRQLNAAIYRDQFAELERDRAEGTLGEDDYQQARMELQRRVLEDGREDEQSAPVAKAPKKTMWTLGVALPVVAASLYLVLGNPEAMNPQAAQHRFTSQEIDRMVAGLAAKLEKEPDNMEGWVMLARSYRALGRLPEAEKAFDHAAKAIDKDAQLLADYADVVAANGGGRFAGKATALIEKALKADPGNPQARWLSGSAAFQRGDFARAIADWEGLVKELPADSDDARMLKDSIAEARAAAKMKSLGGSGK